VDDLIRRKLLLNGKVSSKFRLKICQALKEGACGMFRWVALSLQRLQAIKFLPDFKAALGKLPSQLSGLYDIIYTEIDTTDAFGRSAAISTLTLLLCSQRLLSTKELIAAVYIQSVNELHSSLDSDDTSESDGASSDAESESEVPSPDHILQLCRNFVVMDSEAGVFRFAHPSVREYLVQRPGYTFEEQHALATKICLAAYLTETHLNSPTHTLVKNLEILKMYAKTFWPVHYKHVDDYVYGRKTEEVQQTSIKDARTSVSQFLIENTDRYIVWTNDIAKLKAPSRAALNVSLGLNWEDRLGESLIFVAQSAPVPLDAVCAFGLSTILSEVPCLLLTSWIQLRSNKKYTLLHLAAGGGHLAVVQLLLARDDVFADSRDDNQRTPLSYAAGRGHVAIVQLLLDKGADVKAVNEYGWTPLHYTSNNGYLDIAQLLLDKGANIEAANKGGRTPLHCASSYGNLDIAQLLLNKGANIEAVDKGGWTPLHYASSNGYLDIAQLLLNKGANIEAVDKGGWTPLHYASGCGYLDIAQVLLNWGTNVVQRHDLVSPSQIKEKNTEERLDLM
jgi:ankyrin repeat protein